LKNICARSIKLFAGLGITVVGIVQGKEARHHIGEPESLKPSRSMVHIAG
jgi:cyclic pyranopterin phosphate synthase